MGPEGAAAALGARSLVHAGSGTLRHEQEPNPRAAIRNARVPLGTPDPSHGIHDHLRGAVTQLWNRVATALAVTKRVVVVGDSMRLTFVALAVTFVGGGIAWAAGAITAFGSISAESSDPAQRARIVTEAPAWVGVAKPLGLALMAAAVVGAGAFWLRRR